MSAATLDQVLDEAMQLSLEQQEMLLEILKRRQSERNRREIGDDAKASIAEFRAGYTVTQSTDEVITDLHSSLDEYPRSAKSTTTQTHSCSLHTNLHSTAA